MGAWSTPSALQESHVVRMYSDNANRCYSWHLLRYSFQRSQIYENRPCMNILCSRAGWDARTTDLYVCDSLLGRCAGAPLLL